MPHLIKSHNGHTARANKPGYKPGNSENPVTGIKAGRIDFSRINHLALGSCYGLLKSWLPDGQLKGREWVAKNPTRNDKKAGSFCINVDTGKWADFATGDRGGDVVSLYAYLNGLSQLEAAKNLSVALGGGHA